MNNLQTFCLAALVEPNDFCSVFDFIIVLLRVLVFDAIDQLFRVCLSSLKDWEGI